MTDEPIVSSAVLDPELFSMLKKLRKDIAHKLEIPPYVIFQDVSLEQMAMMYPINEQELQNIQRRRSWESKNAMGRSSVS